ncbi:MAG: hypothetical protein SO251_00120 [Candidatus Fimisoma sp.]|nr:hypothetical protein [Candidatus Fimisoma sp.]
MVSEAQNQPKWERDEVVLLIVTYFRNKNKSDEEVLRSQIMVSDILRKRFKVINGYEPDDLFRNLNGIILQSGRIKSLDPETKYSGMQPTKLQLEVFEEYKNNPERLCAEAYDLVMKYY